jgi:L-rhamnose mutarotase
MTMAKYCIVCEVKSEYLEEYKRLHREIHKGKYKDLLRVIKESGVEEELVFMHGNLAIIFFRAEDLDGCYERQGRTDVAKEWNKLMSPMFASSYQFNVSEKLPVSEKVFDLNEQLEGKLNQ